MVSTSIQRWYSIIKKRIEIRDFKVNIHTVKSKFSHRRSIISMILNQHHRLGLVWK